MAINLNFTGRIPTQKVQGELARHADRYTQHTYTHTYMHKDVAVVPQHYVQRVKKRNQINVFGVQTDVIYNETFASKWNHLVNKQSSSEQSDDDSASTQDTNKTRRNDKHADVLINDIDL